MAEISSIPFRHRLAVRQTLPVLASLALLLGAVLLGGYWYMRENILHTVRDRVRQISEATAFAYDHFRGRAEEKVAAVARFLEEMEPELAARELGREDSSLSRIIAAHLASEPFHLALVLTVAAEDGGWVEAAYARSPEDSSRITVLWREQKASLQSGGQNQTAGPEEDRWRLLPPGFSGSGRPDHALLPAENRNVLMLHTTPLLRRKPGGAPRPLGSLSLIVSMAWLAPIVGSMVSINQTDALILSSGGAYLAPKNVYYAGTLLDLSEDMGEPALQELGRSMLAGESGSMVIPWNGAERLALYLPLAAQGISLAVLIPENILTRPVKMLNRQILALMLGLFFLAAAGLYAITRSMLRPVRSLMGMAERLSRRDFRADPPAGRKLSFWSAAAAAPPPDEPGRLIRAANALRLTLKQRVEDLTLVAEARERLTGELALARCIQNGVRPKTLPRTKTLETAALLRTAQPVSSTLYDAFFRTGNNLCCILVDVVAKGIPAALFLGRVMPLLRETLLAGASPGRSLETVNKVLFLGKKRTEPAIFAHVLAGTLDAGSGLFTWAGAGPSLPILLRGGARTLDGSRGDPLGLRPYSFFPSHSLFLQPEDSLFLATDGLGLVASPQGVLYREKRLASSLSEWQAVPGQVGGGPAGGDRRKEAEILQGDAFLRRLLKDVADHAYPDDLPEDIAMMLILWKGQTAH
ncbi:MAG: SpoIIE family protein phosphatase [Desulfovibrio sp.]|jgi:hypothetical protein|nr:SpoIIE family protein phosphatase [Desulfovibrio sp.]